MKKLVKIALLSLPLFFAAEGCTTEPNYYKGCAILYLERPEFYLVKDLDKDKRADAMVNEQGVAEYYVPGYENNLSITDESKKMPRKLREVASNFVDDENLYHFMLEEAEKKGDWKYTQVQRQLAASNYFKSAEKLKREIKKLEKTTISKTFSDF